MKEQLLTLFLKAVTVAAGISVVYGILTLVTGPLSFSTQSIQTTKTSLFQASGTGSVTMSPDTAQITVGVTKNASTVADAQKQINTAMQNMIAAFKALHIEDKNITTTQYTIYPNYNQIPGTAAGQASGYTATQTVEVKAPIALASQVIDTSTKNGANITGQVQFTLNDDAQQKATQQAREKAVQNAKQKAQSLASVAGIRLGKIVDVQEDTGAPRIMPLMAGGSAINSKDSVQTALPSGSTTITSNVTLSYETK